MMKRLLAYLIAFLLAFSAPWSIAAEREGGKSSAQKAQKERQAKKGKQAQKAKSKQVAKKSGKAEARKAASKKAAGKKAAGKKLVAKHKKASKTLAKKPASQRHRLASRDKTTVGRGHDAAAQPRRFAAVGAAGAGMALSPDLLSLPEARGDVHVGPLELRSAAALIIDQSTGEQLYAKNPDLATPIASITKLMTSMVVLDAELAMSESITINDEDVDRLKYTSSRLALGTTLSREELLHLALIASENRAAAALSRAYPGGRDAFVRAMNRKAISLGMRNTWFVDGTGLDSGNRSTAADLARLVNAAYNYPEIRRISSTGQYDISVPGRQMVRVRENGKVRRVAREVTRHVAFNNTNMLTRNPDWDIGISKTGFINEAGHCLVMQTRIGQRPVIMVLLDSWGKMSRIGDAARVRRWLETQQTAHMDRARRDHNA